VAYYPSLEEASMDVTTESAEKIRAEARLKLGDFLVAEYGHVSDFLIHNEESGEKRAAFFVTLVGAAGGVLGFVLGQTPPIVSRDDMPGAAATVASILLCLGVLTVRRLIERHIVTDECIFALRTFRRLFVTQAEAATVSNAFFNPYGSPRRERSSNVLSIGRGGWLETVTFFNGLLMGTIILAGLLTWRVPGAWPVVVVVVAATWFSQLRWARREIANARDTLKKADPFA
jgi:hypothetical protein